MCVCVFGFYDVYVCGFYNVCVCEFYNGVRVDSIMCVCVCVGFIIIVCVL